MDAETLSHATTELVAIPRAALAALPWLHGVPAATLDALVGHAVLHRMPPGSLLLKQAEATEARSFVPLLPQPLGHDGRNPRQ